MTLLCERCYGPIDPAGEDYVRLAHISHAEPSGDVVWNDATVHTAQSCPALVHADGAGRHRRAA
ncbi:hypothetical protein [Pseudonocardia sp. KRD291]|uniref:hypothetical protein n=1 Tax=Pseudonocardia sp. KRD291 TaxID=2792007 RepID=UPI001C4A4CF4|nr:hypothetical protein [Pseudonocardia sp. KRD291]MBW0106120.1 hypothetical protein [Pseudonocardia sp. KRD291]